MVRGLILALIYLCVSTAAWAATGNDNATGAADSYMKERVPRKLALIIGNYTYPELGDLPGVQSDISNVEDRFRKLGFDIVEPHSNVRTWDDFDLDILKPFRAKIQRDDLAVVYLSGHGFSYLGYQYFAPTTMSMPLVENKIATTAISVDNVIDALGHEGPGAVVLIVDACRTIPNFTVVDRDGKTIPKGQDVADVKPQSATSYVLALSVTNGHPSQAFADPNEMSVYTKALVDRILEEKTFHSIHQDVEGDVMDATDNHQIPVQLQSARTDIVFKATESWRQAEREMWEGLVKEGDRTKIRQFAQRKTLSPYVREARQWLDDHPQETGETTVRRVAISPLGVDAAWLLSQDIKGLSSVVSFPASMPFETKTTDLHDIENKFGIKPQSDRVRPTPDALASWSRQVAEYRDIAFNQAIQAYAEPSNDSHPIKNFEVGDSASFESVVNEPPRTTVVTDVVPQNHCMKIAGKQFCHQVPELVSKIEIDPTWTPRSWTSLAIGPENTTAYVAIDDGNSAYNVDIGKPYRELIVKQREAAPAGLVDQGPILESLKRIKAEGKSISWVSIAAPVADEAGGEAADINFMISNLSFLLNRSGVSLDTVTSVLGDPAVTKDTLRVRFYVR